MTIEIIAVERDFGSNRTTLVTVEKDGESYQFKAGRHTGLNQIKRLAATLKLEGLEDIDEI